MKTARNVLWIIFVVSIVVLVAMPSWVSTLDTSSPGGLPESVPASLVLWIPLITALISLIGALTTSILTMRRDRLESQKIELEVTKLQLEIDRLKQDVESNSPDQSLDQNIE